MTTYQNFSGPEGVDPYNYDSSKTPESVPVDGLDFEPANDPEAGSESAEKIQEFEQMIGERDRLWDENQKVEALALNDKIYQSISNAMEDREINPLEAAPLNKNCREFRDQPYSDAA